MTRSSEGIRRKPEIFVKIEITYEVFIFLKSLGVEGNVEIRGACHISETQLL